MEHERGSAGIAETTTGNERQQGSEVAREGRAEAREVADTARDQGRQLADEAKTQLRNVTEDARDQLREQVSQQAEKAGDSLRRLGEQVSAFAQGRVEEAGPLPDYTRSAAERLQSTADRVQQQGFDAVIEDTKRFARRRPGAFLCAAALAGFAAGRLLRGGSEARKQQHDESRTSGTGTGSAAWPTGTAAAGEPEGTGR